jgi:hypothetical protein
MKNTVAAVAALLFLYAVGVRAEMCERVVHDKPMSEGAVRETDYFQLLFPNSIRQGDRTWNEMLLECNRARDSNGNRIKSATQADVPEVAAGELQRFDLPEKRIDGRYQYQGRLLANIYDYTYVLSKSRGVWNATIPYKVVINDLVKDRIDFDMGVRVWDCRTNSLSSLAPSNRHAWQLYEPSQIVGAHPGVDKPLPTGAAGKQLVYKLKQHAQPIAVTLCSNSTFFPGEERKYDQKNDLNSYKRDPENKHISLGKIQYRYDKEGSVYEGCRVRKDQELFWKDSDGVLRRTNAADWLIDNFVRVIESYWSIPNVFQVRVLIEGRNEADFSSATRALLRNRNLTTLRFATKFSYDEAVMYKSNPLMFNNFSTMMHDRDYRHEAGHALGLDDEYALDQTPIRRTSCFHSDFHPSLDVMSYIMCSLNAPELRSIYAYIPISRYLVGDK